MIDVRSLVGTHDVLFVTLDALRYDVARDLLDRGRTPRLAAVLPPGGWELRHSPGTFTLPAHQAFFAGFLPTPARPGKHVRPFAIRFPGSESTGDRTAVFDAPDIVSGFASRGYRTICIGGVGFFNGATPLGAVLPAYFQESHWTPKLGVNDPRSTENQVELARSLLAAAPRDPRIFLFVNVSAIHHPNRHYRPGAERDSLASHGAALEYVDGQLGGLFDAVRSRGPAFCIVCSDHGTAYGEDGFWGHRVSHPAVSQVPYAEFMVEGRAP